MLLVTVAFRSMLAVLGEGSRHSLLFEGKKHKPCEHSSAVAYVQHGGVMVGSTSGWRGCWKPLQHLPPLGCHVILMPEMLQLFLVNIYR